jgi:spore coat polysaccharide biosynthesis protein SpsF
VGGTGIVTGIFLQVRLASKRLYRKALLPLINGNVIQHAMRALKKVPVHVYALLTDKKSAPDLQVFAEKEGFSLFTGPEDDVLARFCRAARFYHVTRIIRATGDNPLVSPQLAREILEIHEKKAPDLSHFINMPLGTGVEVVEANALSKAEQHITDPFEREHLTTHLYRNSKTYKVLHVPCPEKYRLPDIHVSIDTREDYEIILGIYKDLYENKPIETDKVVDWLKKNGKKFFESRQK